MYEKVVPVPGASLATDIYLPRHDRGTRLPALLLRTPYGRRDLPQIIQEVNILRAHEEGFAVVVQDIRGCGDSTGLFDAKRSDGADGESSIAWIRAQSWNDGNVATIGASFASMVQFLTAQRRPPGLRAIAPMMGGSERDLWITGGALRLAGVTAWVADYIRRGALGQAERVEQRTGLEAYLSASPRDRLHDLLTPGSYARAATEMLAAWFTCDPKDPFWTEVDIPGEPAAASIHVTGWYDACRDTTIDAYERLSAASCQPHELIIGPWTHSWPTHDGAADYNCNGAYPLEGDDPASAARRVLRFLGRAVGDRTFEEDRVVHSFVLGANRWISHRSWPPPDAQPQHWLLTTGPKDSGRSGGLTRTAPGDVTAVTYRYDPMDPAPTVGGATCVPTRYGPRDVSGLHLRPDVLLFATDVLGEKVEIAGRVAAKLVLDSTARSTDFVVRLVLLRPNGEAIPLCHGYWSGYLTDLPIAAGVSEARSCSIAMGHICVRLGPEDRLGLQVTSSDYPEIYPNANTGHRLRDGLPTRTIIATQTLVVGGDSGSIISIDVRRGDQGKG
jgi:putative CocE/NonD family hydrolase